MTRPPEFDELVGAEVSGEERERLRCTHELLVAAGPPPELSPALESGPTLATTLGRRRRAPGGRLMLLAAALAALAVAFAGGYIAGNNGGGTTAGTVLKLAGTKAAPAALASLVVQPRDAAGNWPMQLSVTGLPKLPPHGYYEVYLVRNGKPWAPCGIFKVGGADTGTSVHLNAPYPLRRGDTWIVTRQLPGQQEPGTPVLRPVV